MCVRGQYLDATKQVVLRRKNSAVETNRGGGRTLGTFGKERGTANVGREGIGLTGVNEGACSWTRNGVASFECLGLVV